MNEYGSIIIETYLSGLFLSGSFDYGSICHNNFNKQTEICTRALCAAYIIIMLTSNTFVNKSFSHTSIT